MFRFAGQTFETVAVARLFSTLTALAPELGRCSWMVERVIYIGDDEEGYEQDVRIEECGAEAVFHNNGFHCTAGHEHTSMEARERAGWDYAEDAYDAAVITKGGREFRPMGPGTFIDPHEVAHVMAAI